ncbi:SpoIIIAH-like family protein [Cohnella sp. LGH]|uniref:SpoIIIAH-like family protein n=1 Tax=Cohnella sp. LGH TaxID=1619153 RepID=UPI001AD9B49B|nr:SpoIIIAH-like family protein [Cohnella sp. LGH]QTH44734.1 SpoIIIAH-like family protein [Cohnella sp. LGH]
MNNKRQTIWLVSMLSLMVILSAYYLFSEDAPSTNKAAGGANQAIEEAGKVSATNPDGVTVQQVDRMTDELPDAETGATGTGEEMSPEDQEVLKGIANAVGNDRLEQIAYDRMNKVSKRSEELSATIGNAKATQEEATAAAEELDRLEDLDLRITSLQEKLLQEFDNAVVDEVDSKFKVIVLSDKLEKKQAIGIIDLATKELNVGPERVSVQYVD